MTGAHEEHKHPNYIAVFILLCIFTAVSFLTVSEFYLSRWSAESGNMIVMVVAVIKSLLVAVYFMHLKYDWFKVYMMIVPALFLGAIAMTALLPDITFSDTRIIYHESVAQAAH